MLELKEQGERALALVERLVLVAQDLQDLGLNAHHLLGLLVALSQPLLQPEAVDLADGQKHGGCLFLREDCGLLVLGFDLFL